MTIRVLLADDQAMLVSALSTILNSEDDIEVVATASSGVEAVEKCSQHLIDVAVLDIRMPKMDGIAAAKVMLASNPRLRIVMLTTFSDDSLVTAALQAGVHGFLLKDADPEVLISAVRTVYSGESVLASKVTGPVLAAYRNAIQNAGVLSAMERQGLSCVTNREMDVLLLVAHGATNQEIAAELRIAETTVKTHVSALLNKLYARDRVALVLLAHRAGLSS